MQKDKNYTNMQVKRLNCVGSLHTRNLLVAGGQAQDILRKAPSGRSVWVSDAPLRNHVSDLQRSFTLSQVSMLQPTDKWINIDDTTAALTPTSHNPREVNDTFPFNWPHTTNQISGIRTFHYNDDVPAKAWVLWAVTNNIKVLVGLTLGTDNASAEIEAFSTDYMNASASVKALYDANVVGIAIGNEQTSVSSMNSGITTCRSKIALNQLPNVPVSTVLVFTEQWLENTYPPENGTFTSDFLSLVPNLDFIAFNIYPFWSLGNIPPLTFNQALETSLSYTSNTSEFSILLNSVGAIRNAMDKESITKPFWLTETGWNSTVISGESPQWSNITNLVTYYTRFLGFDLTKSFVPQASTTMVSPPEKIFWYSVRDVPTRPEYFGLYSQNAVLQQKV